MGRKVTIAGGRAASVTTGVVADNNALVWTAKDEGEAANSIAILMRKPAAINQTLSVDVKTGSTTRITVNLATNGSGAVTSTGTLVDAAVAADTEANALVGVEDADGSSGAGVVKPTGLVYLTGGRDEAPERGVLMPDGNTYGVGDEVILTDDEWNQLSSNIITSGFVTDGGNVATDGDEVVTQAATVAAIGTPGSASAGDVATKVNEVLTALKGAGKPMANA